MSQKIQKHTCVRRIAGRMSTPVAQRPRRVRRVAPDRPGEEGEGDRGMVTRVHPGRDLARVTDRRIAESYSRLLSGERARGVTVALLVTLPASQEDVKQQARRQAGQR